MWQSNSTCTLPAFAWVQVISRKENYIESTTVPICIHWNLRRESDKFVIYGRMSEVNWIHFGKSRNGKINLSLSKYLSLYPSKLSNLFVCLPTYLYLSVYLNIYLVVNLSVWTFICQSFFFIFFLFLFFCVSFFW